MNARSDGVLSSHTGFPNTWLARAQEVRLKYQPDPIWFDFELGSAIPADDQRRLFATAYHGAAQQRREIHRPPRQPRGRRRYPSSFGLAPSLPASRVARL